MGFIDPSEATAEAAPSKGVSDPPPLFLPALELGFCEKSNIAQQTCFHFHSCSLASCVGFVGFVRANLEVSDVWTEFTHYLRKDGVTGARSGPGGPQLSDL